APRARTRSCAARRTDRDRPTRRGADKHSAAIPAQSPPDCADLPRACEGTSADTTRAAAVRFGSFAMASTPARLTLRALFVWRCRALLFVRLFRVTRLIKLHLKSSRHLEVRHEPVAVVSYAVSELDASLLQLRDRLLDVLAVEGDIVSS